MTIGISLPRLFVQPSSIKKDPIYFPSWLAMLLTYTCESMESSRVLKAAWQVASRLLLLKTCGNPTLFKVYLTAIQVTVFAVAILRLHQILCLD